MHFLEVGYASHIYDRLKLICIGFNALLCYNEPKELPNLNPESALSGIETFFVFTYGL